MDSRVAVMLSLVAGLCLPATADAASVTVQKLDGSSRSFELAELTRDVNKPYVVRTTAGEQSVPVEGTSLQALLQEAGADTIGAGSIEISGGGRKVVLDPSQLSGGEAGSPVVYADAGRAEFLRPAYSADDLNGDDRLSGPSLAVRVRKGVALTVDGKASDVTVKEGQRVTFTASGRGGAGQELVYRWTFGDGSGRGSGAKITHRFTEQGSYNVLVSVSTPEDRVGATDVVRVRVGPAPKGPARAGGGTDDDAAAPDSGTAAGGGSGASGGTGQAESGPARAPKVAAPVKRPKPATAPAGERRLEGTLLTGALTVPPRPAARKRAARTGNDDPGVGSSPVPGVAWGVLVTLGLAGTGALIELRTVLPWPRRTA